MRISDIISLGKEALFLAIIAVVLFAAIWLLGYKLIYKKKMHGKKQISLGKMAWICIFAVYVIVVLLVTLARPGMGGVYEGSSNWKPFSSYKEAWYNFQPREWRNLILNICMFIPMGVLVPICFNKIDRAWKTYLCGFAFTLLIEITQLVTGRGVFETDDIINNTVGTMIGYGFYAIVMLVIGAIKRGKARVTEDTENNLGVNSVFKQRKRHNGRNCILAQIPLALTIIAFVVVFAAYNSREYGNLFIDNTGKRSVNVFLADGVELSDKADKLEVYTVHRADEDETREVAEKYFSKYDTEIDESQTDRYDDTIIYKSKPMGNDGSDLSIWCDYDGPTYSFTDFSLIGETVDSAGQDLGFTEEDVRKKLEALDIFIPENAVFSIDDIYSSGNYKFTDKGEVLDDGLFYKGTIECTLVPAGEVESVSDNMIKYKPYKDVDVISEKEAYDQLCAGKFYTDGANGRKLDIEVKSVELIYMDDSKGYYRPVYEFSVDAGDSDVTNIMIDAMK
ncbi:VanZ family protein [Agathobacter sp.]